MKITSNAIILVMTIVLAMLVVLTSCSSTKTAQFTGSRNYHKLTNIQKKKISKCSKMKYVKQDWKRNKNN